MEAAAEGDRGSADSTGQPLHFHHTCVCFGLAAFTFDVQRWTCVTLVPQRRLRLPQAAFYRRLFGSNRSIIR